MKQKILLVVLMTVVLGTLFYLLEYPKQQGDVIITGELKLNQRPNAQDLRKRGFDSTNYAIVTIKSETITDTLSIERSQIAGKKFPLQAHLMKPILGCDCQRSLEIIQ